MIKDAILNLKERNGSSRQAIKKYVQANNKISAASPAVFDSQFNRSLKAGVENGDFAQPKGPSGPVKLAKKEAKPAAAKATTKVCSLLLRIYTRWSILIRACSETRCQEGCWPQEGCCTKEDRDQGRCPQESRRQAQDRRAQEESSQLRSSRNGEGFRDRKDQVRPSHQDHQASRSQEGSTEKGGPKEVGHSQEEG